MVAVAVIEIQIFLAEAQHHGASTRNMKHCIIKADILISIL